MARKFSEESLSCRRSGGSTKRSAARFGSEQIWTRMGSHHWSSEKSEGQARITVNAVLGVCTRQSYCEAHLNATKMRLSASRFNHFTRTNNIVVAASRLPMDFHEPPKCFRSTASCVANRYPIPKGTHIVGPDPFRQQSCVGTQDFDQVLARGPV